jgi:hypothetical protein
MIFKLHGRMLAHSRPAVKGLARLSILSRYWGAVA